MSTHYSGWELDSQDRQRLLEVFAPVYPDVIAHHVTKAFPVDADARKPREVDAAVVGVADDGKRVQALVVQINGKTTRPDGWTYHITWSIDRSLKAKPFHSNIVIKENGFVAIDPVPIRLTPRVFQSTPSAT